MKTTSSQPIKTISRIERLYNSVNGNPRYELGFDDATSARTSSDISDAYNIGNPGYRVGDTVVLTLTRAGWIAGIDTAPTVIEQMAAAGGAGEDTEGDAAEEAAWALEPKEPVTVWAMMKITPIIHPGEDYALVKGDISHALMKAANHIENRGIIEGETHDLSNHRHKIFYCLGEEV